MKLALVCDDLIQNGGAERVLDFVSQMFPDAPIYTSVATEHWLNLFRKRGHTVRTSFLQKLPFATYLNRVYSVFFLHIFAFESFDLSNYDIVLSLSSRYAHFVITKPSTTHICYCHSPGRMFWEPFSYFERESFGGVSFLRGLARLFLQIPLSFLRIMDYVAAQHVDYFIANSVVAKNRIKKYYGRDSKVINPFSDITVSFQNSVKDSNYFLVLTRLAAWKRVDIAVAACTKLGLKLKVIGKGPDLPHLKRFAGPTVQLMGFVSEQEKLNLLANCTALINTQFEDFGIVPVEAMALGKPVIAYRKGGALETIVAGKTGEFFDYQIPENLAETLKNFNATNYSSDDCRKQAVKFTKTHFKAQLLKFLADVVSASARYGK